MVDSTRKILLVVPSCKFMYQGTVIRNGSIYSPNLSLATIAGALIAQKNQVQILDLNKQSEQAYVEAIATFNPAYIGFTFTTPLADEALRLASIAKKIKPHAIILAGGPHSTVMPEQVLSYPAFDIVCKGEADRSVCEVVSGKPLSQINSIVYKQAGNQTEDVKLNYAPVVDIFSELDFLALPAWNLYNVASYKTAGFISRKNPIGLIETSRGCPYGCIYCNKKIFGSNFRAKSILRVVNEMEYTLGCGFREIHFSDDCFSFDLGRAKGICEEILKRGLKFPWSTTNGIRVDRVDFELLRLMKAAGCYRVCFGIESGDQGILNAAHKGHTCGQVCSAVEWAKKAKLEVFGYFMFGLPGETKVTMRKTIDFAKKLNLDMAKVSIAVPLPGTEYFEQLRSQGAIKNASWSKYNFYFPASDIYQILNLDWDTVGVFFKKFYQEFYLRPGFILRRFIKSLVYGRLISDIRSFLAAKW